MSFNAIHENKVLTKISESTVTRISEYFEQSDSIILEVLLFLNKQQSKPMVSVQSTLTRHSSSCNELLQSYDLGSQISGDPTLELN